MSNPTSQLSSTVDAKLRELLTPQGDFAALVKHPVKSVDKDAPRLDLLYLRILERGPDVESLAEIVASQVINYAVPRRKHKELVERVKANDLSAYSRLQSEAKRAFIEYDQRATTGKKNTNTRYSEIGEVLAFCIANHFLNAGQVAPKMALKTNSEMPVFGLDGIHISILPDKTVAIYYLESKMAGHAASGLQDYIDSASGFESDRAQKLNEYRIVADLGNLDVVAEAEKETAMQFFNPYSAAQGVIRERFVGVITYTEPLMNEKIASTDATPVNARELVFATKFIAHNDALLSTMKRRIKTRAMDASRCRAFVLAVPDIDLLRTHFMEAMQR